MQQTMNHISQLPVVTEIRDVGSLHAPLSGKLLQAGKYEGIREDIKFIRDSEKDTVYFVMHGGGANTSSDSIVAGRMLKIGDTIIFNGTDEHGFDMATVSHIDDESFHVKYVEFINDTVIRKCRNLNRLPKPEDFSSTVLLPVNDWNAPFAGNAHILTMKFKKFNESANRQWFLVIHTQTDEEYEEEYEEEYNLQYETDNESDDDTDVDNIENYTNYHCTECWGGTPIQRELCRRLSNDATIRAYSVAAYRAFHYEDEYDPGIAITMWPVLIDGNEYYIDYNNVLFDGQDGLAIGYAKPSNRQGLVDAELFDAVLFDQYGEEQVSAPPPKYLDPPQYVRHETTDL